MQKSKLDQKRSKFHFSYRMKLSAQFFTLTVLTIGGLSAFFLSVYSREKLASSYERKLSDMIQAAQYLENAVLSARDFTSEQVQSSPIVVFAVDGICEGTFAQLVSKSYSTTFARLNSDAKQWIPERLISAACGEFNKTNGSPFILAGAEIPFSIIPVLVRKANAETRLLAISTDSFSGGMSSAVMGLVDQKGIPLWTPSGPLASFTTQSLAIIPNQAALASKTTEAVNQGLASVSPIGEGGILAIAPVLSQWALVALETDSAILKPVRFLLQQALWLTGGFFFLCLLAGKLIADRVSKPIRELASAAQEFGSGNLEPRVEVTRKDELGVLQGTFNVMADKIKVLLEEARTRALLEADVHLAQRVQEMLFPPRAVSLRDHEINSFVKMASKCGGDWWGYIDVPENISPLLLVLIGDVTGHGVSSALLTAAAQGGASVLTSWVKAQPEMAKDPRVLLELFNKAVYESARGTVQMSFFSAVIDVQANLLHASCAGHNWPYLITPSDDASGSATVATIGHKGQVLGHGPDAEFKDIVSVSWTPGTQLFLYTDGLIDAYQGDSNKFDRRALVRVLKNYSKLHGAALLKKVLEARAAAVGNIAQADDITAVVCVRKATS